MRPGATCATGRVRLRSESVLLGYRAGGREALGEGGEGGGVTSSSRTGRGLGRQEEGDARETLGRRWTDAGMGGVSVPLEENLSGAVWWWDSVIIEWCPVYKAIIFF